MKYFIATLFAFTNCLPVSAQGDTENRLLQTNGKKQRYYVDLTSTGGSVYKMGIYLDKAGRGSAIVSTDTLEKRTDGIYEGKHSRIVRENDQLYLITGDKKTVRRQLATSEHINVANNDLNNAYYLGQYFKMSDVLNKKYPLNHHSFREGFAGWRVLAGKETDHKQFRILADEQLKKLKDSICVVQDRRVELSGYLVQNVRSLDYGTLKDSLTQLPCEYRSQSWYFGTVVQRVAAERPEYFFRLAEDFPAHRNLIFHAAGNNREIIAALKNVEGHDVVKKAFFKERRSDKTMPYRVLGAYAIVGGLVALLIALK